MYEECRTHCLNWHDMVCDLLRCSCSGSIIFFIITCIQASIQPMRNVEGNQWDFPMEYLAATWQCKIPVQLNLASHNNSSPTELPPLYVRACVCVCMHCCSFFCISCCTHTMLHISPTCMAISHSLCSSWCPDRATFPAWQHKHGRTCRCVKAVQLLFS